MQILALQWGYPLKLRLMNSAYSTFGHLLFRSQRVFHTSVVDHQAVDNSTSKHFEPDAFTSCFKLKVSFRYAIPKFFLAPNRDDMQRVISGLPSCHLQPLLQLIDAPQLD